MAVEPLYNEDLDTLLKRARMSTTDDEQTLALLYQTINEVRLKFYSTLGTDWAITIAGYSLVDNPTTDEQILRSTGANTEALWLTWLLAQRLPFTSLDNRASVQDLFNSEQLTRDATGLKDFLSALKSQIDKGVASMQSPSAEDSGAVKASSIAPDETDMVYDRFRGLYPYGTSTSIGCNCGVTNNLGSICGD
jgi:hypothetical protein